MHTRTLGQWLRVSAIRLRLHGPESEPLLAHPYPRGGHRAHPRRRRPGRHLLRHRRGVRPVHQRGNRRCGPRAGARPGRHRHEVRLPPNVSKRPTSGSDPLRHYEASISLLRGRRPRLVLPGHERAFDRLEGRLVAILGHHRARLTEVEAVVRQGRTTVWEIAEAVSWSRPFSHLSARAIRSALGETWAQLQRLTALGRIIDADGHPRWWHPVAAAPGADSATPRLWPCDRATAARLVGDETGRDVDRPGQHIPRGPGAEGAAAEVPSP